MSWLQKRPQASDSIQFYSTSLTKTKLLVGLGNPGKEYDGTRHNVGFACLDYFVAASDDMGDWIVRKDKKCIESTGRFGDARVIAIKPTTFMNLSGEAVQAIAAFYKIAPENIIVIHDELDIDFGQIRVRSGGSSAGHNGLKSIIEHLGEDFGRIRIGIGPKTPARMSGANFVLQAFNESEREQLPNLYRETAAIITENVYSEKLANETRSFLI